MKIQCDMCEKAPATVICCADEAALCAKCDLEVHAANKLASKHQRLSLQSLSNNLLRCDICQEKTAFIFCVEDRALFCKDCDEPIHSANKRAAGHQRFLAAGIRVALSSGSDGCCGKADKNNQQSQPKPPKMSIPQQSSSNSSKASLQQVPSFAPVSWAVDDLLQLSDHDSVAKGQFEFNELDWLKDIDFFSEQVTQKSVSAAEVPELRAYQPQSTNSYRQAKYYPVHKKARIEIPDDEEDMFTVPDLG